MPDKPYEIRERVFQFVLCVIARYPDRDWLNPPSYRSWAQLFNSASSTGAHLEEADAASSKRHKLTLKQGALREMREAKYWLRVIVAGKLAGWQTVAQLTDEAPQLVAILTTMVRNAESDCED